MEITTKVMSDEEDDLEMLRLAALQTLKKPTNNVAPVVHSQPQPLKKYNHAPQSKRGRGFHSGPGRGGRNAQFNGRVRNTNLISIPTVEPEQVKPPKSSKFTETSAPKLILPQDRYCSKEPQESKAKETSSKFSRYDDSDSESEEDEEEAASESGAGSDTESTAKLERSNSLEALVQELEFEISGEKPLPPPKTKAKKKKRGSLSESESKTELSSTDQEEAEPEKPIKVEDKPIKVQDKPIKEQDKVTKVQDNAIKDEEFRNVSKKEVEDKFTPQPRKLPPMSKRRPKSPNFRRRQNGAKQFHNPFPNDRPAFPQPFVDHNVQLPFNHPANLGYNPNPVPYMQPHPTFQSHLPPLQPNFISHRPLSPLNLNTEVLTTITTAPLSPRSAAFVLQNREIIERRKKSPKRSYSRSPSPRFRHSKSPRSPSPRRAASPRHYFRTTPPRKVARSPPPRKMSPARVVKRATPERKEKTPPKTQSTSPKSSVKERLGTKQNKTEEKKVRTPSPKPKVEVEKPLDPVMEARKRKFEEPTLSAKGIIRLKPKDSDENIQQTPDDDMEDDLLDLEVTDTINDIFSDEEDSDDENEGRFKSVAPTKRQVLVLPFSQLANKREIRDKPLEDPSKKPSSRRDRSRTRRETRRKRAASPPPKTPTEKTRKKPSLTKNTIAIKSERKEEKVMSPVETKKIEIKIRNPAKYESSAEKGDGRKVAVKGEVKKKKEAVVAQKEDETEVIIDEEDEDNDDDNDVAKKSEAGDLRAQLSRKRAERQHRLPVVEDVQGRLLQNALQGAVFKKSKKSRRKEKEAAPKESEPTERKVHLLCSTRQVLLQSQDKIPIHMRLGLSNDSDIFVEPKRKKKKSRNSEQV